MVDLPLQPVDREDSFLLRLPIADADLLAVFFNPDEERRSADLPALRRARPPPYLRTSSGPRGRSSLGSVPRLRVLPRVALPVPASSSKPRASLGRVLDDLGATLLDLVDGDPEAAEEIGGVVIHDPVDAPVLPHTRTRARCRPRRPRAGGAAAAASWVGPVPPRSSSVHPCR